ncbi:unnamed protein product, partial [Arabidopsis halleri]
MAHGTPPSTTRKRIYNLFLIVCIIAYMFGWFTRLCIRQRIQTSGAKSRISFYGFHG